MHPAIRLGQMASAESPRSFQAALVLRQAVMMMIGTVHRMQFDDEVASGFSLRLKSTTAIRVRDHKRGALPLPL